MIDISYFGLLVGEGDGLTDVLDLFQPLVALQVLLERELATDEDIAYLLRSTCRIILDCYSVPLEVIGDIEYTDVWVLHSRYESEPLGF